MQRARISRAADRTREWRAGNMTKKQFIEKYKSLSPEDRQKVKTYYNDLMTSAVFVSTFETAEKHLLWIMEAEQ